VKKEKKREILFCLFTQSKRDKRKTHTQLIFEALFFFKQEAFVY